MTVESATAAYNRALADLRRTYKAHRASPTSETDKALAAARGRLRETQVNIGKAKDCEPYMRTAGAKQS